MNIFDLPPTYCTKSVQVGAWYLYTIIPYNFLPPFYYLIQKKKTFKGEHQQN